MNFDIKTNGDRVEPLEISPNSASNVVPTNKPNNRIRFVTQYAVSICGFSRLAIIVRACFFCLKVAHTKKTNIISYKLQFCQLGAWISCILILKYPISSGALPSDLATTRLAFLIFSIVGFVVSIALYLFQLLNIRNLKPFNKIPDLVLNIIVCKIQNKYYWQIYFQFFYIQIIASDVIWFIPMLVLSVFCVVRVTELQKQASQNAILSLLNSLFYSLFIDVAAFTSTVVTLTTDLIDHTKDTLD